MRFVAAGDCDCCDCCDDSRRALRKIGGDPDIIGDDQRADPAADRGESHRRLGMMIGMQKEALSLVAILAACGSHAAQPQPETATAQHGVFASDLDRTADPCTDFYAYSNGAWRTATPIPASMRRWSRRWQAGETAKDRLKEILDEVSARKDWPGASVEQLIGVASSWRSTSVRNAGSMTFSIAGLTPIAAKYAAQSKLGVSFCKAAGVIA